MNLWVPQKAEFLDQLGDHWFLKKRALLHGVSYVFPSRIKIQLNAIRMCNILNRLCLWLFVMSCHQTSGQNHNSLIANKSFENGAKVIYFGTL
jgi:hypothetical protein